MSKLTLKVKTEVDRLFDEAPDRFNSSRTNPVTGGRFVRGLDPIGPQKRIACRALEARERFAEDGPSDAPPLPLSYAERERLKTGGLSHIVAWYARSLRCLEYDYDAHPSFEDYARGVMAITELDRI